jgi:hypothetical protein
VTAVALINVIRMRLQGLVMRHHERMGFDRVASYEGIFGVLPDTQPNASASEGAQAATNEAAKEQKRRAKQSDALS